MKIFIRPYKPAKLYSGKGDWYVYYHYKNPETGAWDMFKDRGGLNYKDIRSEPKARKIIGEELADTYNERLKSGWSPFGYQEEQSEEYDKLKFLPAIQVLYELQKIKKSSLKTRTWQSYKYSLDVLNKWMIANNMQHTMLEYLKPKHMLQFFDSLQLAGKYKNKSINNHKANLGVLFNAAVERELVIKSPLKGYKKLPEDSGKNFPFSENQKKKLKGKILEEDPDLWLFVKCIYHLFVRPIELLRVKIGDVKLRSNQIIIHSGSAKNKKQLPVEIPKSFIKEIKALKLDQMPEDWYLFGRGLKPGPKSYSRNAVTERHTKMLRACGLNDEKYSMYGWKHTGNQDSFLAGADIFELMRQNRHHSIAQTEAYLNSMGLRPNIGYSTKAPKL